MGVGEPSAAVVEATAAANESEIAVFNVRTSVSNPPSRASCPFTANLPRRGDCLLVETADRVLRLVRTVYPLCRRPILPAFPGRTIRRTFFFSPQKNPVVSRDPAQLTIHWSGLVPRPS